MFEINERTKIVIPLEFYDENGAPVIPASFIYRVDNPATNAEIIAATTVIPTAATHDLVISPTANRCQGNGNEPRRVTCEVANLAAAEYIYTIKKLKGAR